MDKSTNRRLTAVASVGLVATIATCIFVPERPTHALPIFARRYNVPCTACHLIPPKLNKEGLAFQANHFNWPGGHPTTRREGISAIPVSALITTSHQEGQGLETLTSFQTLELFASDGFNVAPGKQGGYWLDYFAAFNPPADPGDLDGAFVELPLLGDKGQTSMTVGQVSPLTYQTDQISNLMQTQPAAFDSQFDSIVFDQSQPQLRLEYYDRRGQITANGNYLNIGFPLTGHLTFNKDSDVDGGDGVYIHGFRRDGYTTMGAFAYSYDGNDYGALIGSAQFGHYLYALGVVATGHSYNAGEQRYLTGQVDFVPYSWLALSGRLEGVAGSSSATIPVATLTLYPFKQYWLHVAAETVQQEGSRSNIVWVFVQL